MIGAILKVLAFIIAAVIMVCTIIAIGAVLSPVLVVLALLVVSLRGL